MSFYFRHQKAKGINVDELDVSHFDTSKVTDMHNMFYNCCDKKLDVSHFDISNVQNLSHMFKDFTGTIIGKERFPKEVFE